MNSYWRWNGRLRDVLLASIAWILLAMASAHASEPCDGIVPDAAARTSRTRAISAEDLVRLRDIGYSHVAPGQRLIGVSPDRRHIAFVMHRADPESNAYCQALIAMSLGAGGRPRLLDQSSELIMQPYSIRGVLVDYGYPTVIVPRWSPDGQWIAYLRRRHGLTQVWRVRADGGEPQQVTHASVDVDLFEWSQDGEAIFFASRPGYSEAQAAIEREGRAGFLYDERIVPYSSSRPAVSGTLAYERVAVDLGTGEQRALTESELAQLPLPGSADPAEQMRNAAGPAGRRAWTARRDPSQYFSPVDLWATTEDGREARCDHPSCSNGMSFDIPGLWWTEDGREIVFLRRGGWGNSSLSAYRWRPGAPAPTRIFSTEDLLIGCELVADDLLCAREGSTQPRQLVLIDLRSGRSRALFNPNPEFDSLQLGSVERLHWRNASDVESYGDLVLPPGDRRGRRLPLIIVQYVTQGFLRGGIADEYPIQLFAARGYAVLSFQRPPTFAASSGDRRSFEDAVAEESVQWRRRRDIHASLVSGVRLLIDRGIVDPQRIGITGASDGATTTQFALINEPGLFSAASVSSCCEEPSGFMIYGGIGLAAERAAWGYPEARGEALEAWRPLSLAMNADAIDTPLLMHMADHEYLMAIDAFMALRHAGNPVEMYVFPDEYHLKWQPAHRLAIYRRNLDWFDFWLRAREDADSAKAVQYKRWRDMRAVRCESRSRGGDCPMRRF